MTTSLEDDALMERAQEFYNSKLREILEPEHNGEFVAIDPIAGLYSVGTEPLAVHADLRAQGGTGLHALLRVGYDWAFDMLGAGC